MAQARYDAVADFYINGFESADDPASVALLDLLGPVTGLRILDVACGHGRITRELARRGADVVGIDISGNLISKARQTEQDEPLGIRYIHADVTAPHVLGGGEFEAVACNFGLSDIDDLDAAITAISGALATAVLTYALLYLRGGIDSIPAILSMLIISAVEFPIAFALTPVMPHPRARPVGSARPRS
jgi:2-polyprenyl-3-methyl-5-hydroxy-6-metoxy-1,4-benzoquinol methylase